MPQNFIPTHRDQQLLMPPDLRDWLPEDHLAWSVLDAVAEMDLSPFYNDYRTDGWGRAAFEPNMVIALLLYAYSVGVRSSREIERRCHDDVAFRVIAGNLAPDHSTISRFLHRHREAITSLFKEVLRLCAAAGLINPSLLVIDGTKIKANANKNKSATLDEIDAFVERAVSEAIATDEQEDERFGEDSRGDEPPEHLATRDRRVAHLKKVKAQLEAEQRELDQADDDKMQQRKTKEEQTGRKTPGRMPTPSRTHQRHKPRKANLTDPEARMMNSHRGWVVGYNGQVIATEDQIILANSLSQNGDDKKHLTPLLKETIELLQEVGVDQRIDAMTADAGYLARYNCEPDVDGAPEMFIAIGNPSSRGTWHIAKGPAGRFMKDKIQSERGRSIVKRRGEIVEPIFGQIKSVRRADTFTRRGLEACATEWSLITTTHNLLKLWRSATRPVLAPGTV